MSISTISFNNASRTQVMRIQTELRDALLETSSSRHADVGRTLGRSTGIAVSYRSQETSLERLLQSNTLVTQRLTLMENALEPLARTVDGVRGQLVTGLANDAFISTAQQGARSALDELAGSLNLSIGGQHLFAGNQTDLRPIVDWDQGPAAAVRAHFAEFTAAAGGAPDAEAVKAYFGTGYTFTDGDGAAQTIAFDDLFRTAADTPPGRWNEIFSQATDEPIRSRISKNEEVASSVSANARPFRDLVAGYAMLDLVSSDMDTATRKVFAESSTARLGAASTGITAVRADLGTRIVRVEGANETIKHQKDIFAAHVSALEEIDYVEASERVASLRTQLEASLRVTGMIREINILDYL